MQCDICGKEKGNFVNAIIEGSLMTVCESCSKFGAVIEKHEEKNDDNPKAKADAGKGFTYSDPAENIIQDFSKVIKEAREKKKMNHEELASSIAEKESVIQKIESGSLTPSVKTAKKLEQYLNIKLIQKEQQLRKPEQKQENQSPDFKNKTLTIGDLMGVKLDKFKKQTGN